MNECVANSLGLETYRFIWVAYPVTDPEQAAAVIVEEYRRRHAGEFRLSNEGDFCNEIAEIANQHILAQLPDGVVPDDGVVAFNQALRQLRLDVRGYFQFCVATTG